MTKKKLVFANNPLLSGPSFGERERLGTPYRIINISAIEPDPNQPRTHFDEEKLRELSDSIKTYGVLSPILVRPTQLPGKYTLISGERRLKAAQLAGLSTIPVLLDQKDDGTEGRTLAMQLVENLQRADLSSLEKAHAIGALRDSYKLSVRDIGEKLGVSKSMVQRSLEILNLPDDLLNALKNGASESKILLLAKIEDPNERARLLKDIDLITRSELENNVHQKSLGMARRIRDFPAEDRRITEEIQRSLGVKVKMMRTSPGSEKGKFVIDFYSDRDLQEIFKRLVNEA